MKARITLETAIIMPIVIVVILFSINMTFYIHDLIIIEGMSYTETVANSDKKADEIIKKVNEKLNKTTTYLIRHNSTNVSVKNGRVNVEIICSCNSELSLFNTMLGYKNLKIEYSIEKRINIKNMYLIKAIEKELVEE